MNCNCLECREHNAEIRKEFLADLSKTTDWEIVDTLDIIDAYDQEVTVELEQDDITYVATGMVSCGELVNVYLETIEIKDY